MKQITIKIKKFLLISDNLRFQQNFEVTFNGNLISQLLLMISSIPLAYLYSPTDYASYTLFSSLLSILLSFSSLCLDWSVPSTRLYTQASALIFVGFISTFLISILGFTIFWLLDFNLVFWQGSEVLKPFLFLFPIALIGNSSQQLLISWFVREANLQAVGKSKILQSVISSLVSIVGGILNLGSLGLIIGFTSGIWSGLVNLTRYADRLLIHVVRLSGARIKTVLYRYWKDAVFSILSSVANTASLSVTPILLVQYYSMVEVGWYSFAIRLVLPVTLLVSAIGQSFWAEAAILVKTDRIALRQLYLRTFNKLILISGFITLIYVFGSNFIDYVFGKKWENAGYILMALAPSILGQVLVSPLSHLVIYRKQHWQFAWDVCRLSLLTVAIIFSASSNLSIYFTVAVTSFINLLMYMALFRLDLLAMELRI